ncbi:extracellular solute-binding protein [Hwanghaeella sp.]|uniref:extracellular solute-binding protein n=1 Tax=Hwanghaeella sp. TaxID=2605943 RepID=UPI003CCC0D69
MTEVISGLNGALGWRRAFGAVFFIAGLTVATGTATASGTNGPSHGFALNHALKYPADFQHLEYVNPDAPKGGLVVEEGSGTFDSLNPFIIKGNAAFQTAMIYDTLMKQVSDEDSAVYGLVAETIEVPEDGSWVEFKLRPEARFHDGKPITAEDVAWTFDTLREKGSPTYQYYYAAVEKVETPDEHTVRFVLYPGENKEMPLILSELVVLPKHYYQDRPFDQTTLEPPLGSGPYKISKVEPGRSLTLERVEDYWGRDLPVSRGFNNFQTIRYDFYRDRTISREAFKAGAVDIWIENSAKEWATAFDIPAVESGAMIKREFANQRVAPMQGFAFNLRKPVFQDIRVREALTYAWDFEWVNKTIMYGAYQRTDSFFDNHELGATGLPSPAELEILNPYRGQIPERVFTEEFVPPQTDGSGNNRQNLKKAAMLLKDAGWSIKNKVLTNEETGEVFTFEIVLRNDQLEPHTQALVRSLERLGIKARIRIVDDAQYRRITETFDFDMVVAVFGQSVSPGNEQRYYWGSAAAAREGSRNLMGITDPAIDELVELLIAAPDRDSLVTRTRALDRVLLWNFFMIPMYHGATDRVAYWNRFGLPDIIPARGVVPDAWWVDPEKDAALTRGKGN